MYVLYFDVINVSINTASTIFSFTHLAIKGLLFHIQYVLVSVIAGKANDALVAQFQNKYQWTVKDSWPFIVESPKGCTAI